MNILCIDDNPVFLEIFRKWLQASARPEDDLYFVDNANQAYDILRHHTIHVVITDLVMPEVSGIQVLLETKKIDPAIQVIVVTGMGSVETAVQAMQLGARDYLQKPVNANLLVQKLEKIREYFDLIHHVENYRFAKETFEQKAGQTIKDMELKLSHCLSLIDSIYHIATRKDDHDDPVVKIISAIDQFNAKF